MTPENHATALRAQRYDHVPDHWYGGDPFVSSLYDALSLLVPLAEAFGVEVVEDCRRCAALSAVLAQRLDVFTRHEVGHQVMHDAWNRHLQRRGQRTVVAASLRAAIARVRRRPPLQRLAVLVAFEHVTTLISLDWFARRRNQPGVAPEVARLWSVHTRDELEHAAASHALYRAMGGGEGVRRWALIELSITLTARLLVQVVDQAWRENLLGRLAWWRGAARFFFGRQGFVWHATPLWLRFFRRDFTPPVVPLPQL